MRPYWSSPSKIFSLAVQTVLTLFLWNKSNASATQPSVVTGGRGAFSVRQNFLVIVVVVAVARSRSNKAQRKERRERSRLWWALQIGTALSAAFHGFLESFQKRHSFVRDGLSFMLFQAIFASLWKLLFSFPDTESIDIDVHFLRMYLAAGGRLECSAFRLPFLPSSCHRGGSPDVTTPSSRHGFLSTLVRAQYQPLWPEADFPLVSFTRWELRIQLFFLNFPKCSSKASPTSVLPYTFLGIKAMLPDFKKKIEVCWYGDLMAMTTEITITKTP